MKRYLSLIALSAAFFSCESLVTDIPASKLPKSESKLVVQSFISPQAETINVAVSESEPLFGTSTAYNDMITDAVVKISDGKKEIDIPYEGYSNIYSIEASKFPIIAGQTYYLTVTSGEKKVTAKCTVPVKSVAIKSFTLDTAQATDNATDLAKFMTLRMNWQDISGEVNYYRVHATMLLEYDVPKTDNSEGGNETRMSTEFNFEWDQSSGRKELQSDKTLDGSIFTSPLGKITALPVVQADKYSLTNQKVKSVTMEVFNADVNYYQYHRDIELRGDSDNPFTEPSLIYSNIVGGLGCFGAYNVGRRVELY